MKKREKDGARGEKMLKKIHILNKQWAAKSSALASAAGPVLVVGITNVP